MKEKGENTMREKVKEISAEDRCRRKIRNGGGRTAVSFLLCIALVCTLFSGCTSGNEDRQQEAQRQEIRAQVRSFDQPVNEDGIAVDLSENPYFMTELSGFEYSQPETITYDSEVTGTQRQASVLLPADYSPEKKYPVLYLIHGLYGSHRTWINKGGDIILQNLTYLWDVPEMIVVFPDCSVNWEGSIDDLSLAEMVEVYDRIEEEMVTSLMPYITSHYSVKEGRENTAVAGNSMGGRNALNLAFRHPDLFGYVGAFSSARVLGDPAASAGMEMPPLIPEFTVNAQAGAFKEILVCVGRQDDVCGAESYRIHENMTKNGVKHIFYDMEGGHDDTVWQNALYNFGRRLFGGARE